MINLGHLALDDFKVAVLTTNIQAGQDLSNSLREYGIYAFYYENLTDLWNLLNSETVHWVICDIVVLRESGLFLGDHPAMKTQKSYLSLFYHQDSKNIMNSIINNKNFNFWNCIDYELPLKIQLRNSLENIQKSIELKNESFRQSKQVDFYKNTHLENVEKVQEYEGIFDLFKRISQLSSDLKKKRNHDQESFLNSLSTLLDQWKDIRSFSYYFLNPSAEKLVSGHFESSMKFIKLPLLWAGKVCDNGIELFLQKMSLQVVFDQMGTDIIFLKIHGFQKNADICLFLELDKKSKLKENAFYWNLFELTMDNHYKFALAQEYVQSEQSEEDFITTWQALEMMKENANYESDNGFKLVNINLNAINKFALSKSQNEFRWKAFFTDFILKIYEKLKGPKRIANYGTMQLLVFLKHDYFEENYINLKKVIAEFEYWEYFENKDMVFNKLYYPSVNIVPPNLNHYLNKYIYSTDKKEKDSISSSNIKSKHKGLIGHNEINI